MHQLHREMISNSLAFFYWLVKLILNQLNLLDHIKITQTCFNFKFELNKKLGGKILLLISLSNIFYQLIILFLD